MILDKIVVQKQREIKAFKQKKYSLKNALAAETMTLIAEIKKASPSKGIISSDFNPERQLQAYTEAGVDAVSILTDKKFFKGDPRILKELRPDSTLPFLRKDFILTPLQIYESLFMGADVVLLIAAILENELLEKLLQLTEELGLEAIVEIHNEEELNMVLNTSAEILGINNRNLKDFTVDLEVTAALINKLNNYGSREDYFIISESGIKSKDDINFLKKLGIDGVLIGETLMKSPNPSQKVKQLFSGLSQF